jgi:hypothetical protein
MSPSDAMALQRGFFEAPLERGDAYMIDEKDLELLRKEVMEEVDVRFNALIRELDEKGSEFSRSLAKDVEAMKKKAKEDIEELWSWSKSQLVSIEQGQRILYDPKDGLLAVALRKVSEAVKFAQDAALCTAASNQSADRAARAAEDTRAFVRTNIFVTAITFLGILITVVTFAVTYSSKSKEESRDAKALIAAMNEKIEQDAANQRETVGLMNKLYRKLGGN